MLDLIPIFQILLGCKNFAPYTIIYFFLFLKDYAILVYENVYIPVNADATVQTALVLKK
jgi:hypothetical protein